MIVRRTIRSRKLRINHDRALFFTAASSQYMNIVPDSRYNFGSSDFWISYFIETSSDSIHFQLVAGTGENVFVENNLSVIRFAIGTDQSAVQFVDFAYSANKNKIIHILINRVGGTFSLFVNGSKKGSAIFATTDTLNFSGLASFPIGTRANLASNYVNGFMNNFVVGEGTITDDQVKLIHALGGVIPEDLHSHVLNHWPLTQKYYYKGPDIKAWDIVEQYNYSKVTPLTAIHGVLTNFTDAEVGADEPANQTAIFDVYTKQVSKDWGLKFTNTQYASDTTLTNTIVQGENDWEIYIDFHETTETGNRLPLRLDGSGVSLFVDTGGISGIRVRLTEGSNVWDFISNEQYNGIHVKLFIKKGNNLYSQFQVIANGKILTNSLATPGDFAGAVNFNWTSLILGAGTGGTDSFTGIINDVQFYDEVLTTSERAQIRKNGGVISSKLVDRVNIAKRSDNQIFMESGNVLIMNGFTLADYEKYYVLRSEYPEIIEGLNLDGSDEHLRDDSPSISYDANGSYTIMLAFRMPNATFQAGTAVDTFVYYRSLDNANRFRIQGEASGDRLQAVFGNQTVSLPFDLDIDRINILFLNFDSNQNCKLYDSCGNLITSVNSSNVVLPRFDLMQEITYGRNALDAGAPRFSGTLIKYAIWSKLLTKKEMINEGDNFLLDTIKVTDSLEDLVIFNSSLFSEDGTNVLLSNLFTGSSIKAIAFDGATTADQLSDLQTNHIVNINTLR